MYTKLLNFYLPQTAGYALGIHIMFFLTIISIIGFLALLLILISKKNEFKKHIISIYFGIIFLLQCNSIIASYHSFHIYKQHLDALATISFLVVFWVFFSVYYIPWIIVLIMNILVNFINNKILLTKNKGGSK